MCIDHSGIMVKTPPYQKWGKCGHFMSQFDSHPCTHGTNVNQCASSSTLSDKQWTHFCESFAKKSSNHNSTGSQNDNVEPELKEEPVFTGKKLSQVNDTLLVLEPEQSGNQLQASVFSLTSHLQLLSQWRIFRQFSRPVLQCSASSALFRRWIQCFQSIILSQWDKHPTDNI